VGLIELDINKLPTKFGQVLNLAKKIPNFEIFLEPYNMLLRNKIVHSDFSIDYVNKKIIYSGGETKFSELLLKSRNLVMIFIVYAWAFNYDMRKDMEKAYVFLETVDN
jgi:hypothetical protein